MKIKHNSIFHTIRNNNQKVAVCRFAVWFILFSAFCRPLGAQVNNTGNMYVSGNVFMNATFVNNPGSGSVYQNDGNLALTGSFTNNQPAMSEGTGTTQFTGSSLQNINGTQSSVFHHVYLSNPAGVIMQLNTTMGGTISTVAGRLFFNGYALTMGGKINTAYTNTSAFNVTNTSDLNITGNAAAGNGIYFDTSANTIHNVTLNPGATGTLGNALYITAGNAFGTVTANGNFNAAGFLTLKSDANGTAIVGPSYGNITGDVIVQRYFSAIRAWRFVAVPFSSTDQTINQAWQEGYTDVVLQCPPQYQGTPGYGTAITYNNTNGYDVHNNNYKPSIEVYQNNTWVIPTSTINAATSNLVGASTNGAYSLFVRGDRSICLTYTAIPFPTTLRPKGVLNQLHSGADMSFNLSSVTNGFVMIGNPYACPVNIRRAIQAGGTGIKYDQFWTWDPQLGGNTGTGGYITFSNGVEVPAGVYKAGTVIQSGQSFMVQLNGGTTGTLSLKETDKTNIETDEGVFGPGFTAGQQQSPSVVYVNLLDQANAVTDGIGAAFGNNFSTAANDEADIQKRWNTEIENIALIRHDTALAIEFRPVPALSDTLFLRLYLRQHPYVLQVFPQNFAMPVRTWLVDKYLNTKTEINLTDTSVYNFTPNADTMSYRNRFMIVFNRQFGATPVPVTKVVNQQDPNTTGISNSMGNAAAGVVSIQPNPVTSSKDAMLRFANMPKGGYEVTLYSMKGQPLSTEKLQHDGSKTMYRLPFVPSLTAGVYTVTVLNETTKQITNIKMVISK